MGVIAQKRELISLSGASRVTCRTMGVLKSWQRAGCFAEDEWVFVTSRTQGRGHPVLVDLVALEREHREHGGSEWHPELAHARNLPQPMGAYVEGLRARVRALEAALERAQRRGVGGGMGVVLPAQAAATVAAAQAGRDPDATKTRPAPARPRRSPAPPFKHDDLLPARGEDRAVSCNEFGEWHGFTHNKTSANWRQAASDGRLEEVVDALKVRGRPWTQGRVKVRFILYHEGRIAFLRRYWHLSYIHACARPGCECAGMPPKDTDGNIFGHPPGEPLDRHPRRTREQLAAAGVE